MEHLGRTLGGQLSPLPQPPSFVVSLDSLYCYTVRFQRNDSLAVYAQPNVFWIQ